MAETKRRKRTEADTANAAYSMGVAKAFLARIQCQDPSKAFTLLVTPLDREMLQHAVSGFHNACAFGHQALGFMLYPSHISNDTTTD